MVLQLTFNEFLKLRDAKGAAIEVLDGKVWITEDGTPGDRFIEKGSSYRVAGQGLVVVGAETGAHFARVLVRKPARRALSALLGSCRKIIQERKNQQARRELRSLSDRMLADIGLRRDEIDSL
jgi:uncharacterized protein YjiS (DUF1127 family)